MENVALYIHFPFCRHKCAYCDFYSITDTSYLPFFIKGLLKEIDLYRYEGVPKINSLANSHKSYRLPLSSQNKKGSSSTPLNPSRRQEEKSASFLTPNLREWQNTADIPHTVSTIYFGGGTPSLMPAKDFRLLLKHITNHFALPDDAEITIEANPDSLSEDFLKHLLDAGLNRLSIGVQSFHDDELRVLGRVHTAKQAETSIETVLNTGVKNWSIDLIFAIPGQTIHRWQETLERTLQFRPNHISLYGLTYEPGTALCQALAAGEIQKCDEELEREMYLLAMDVLGSAGYEQYEISNWALEGYRSQHNQKYWAGTPYLGLGPAAHSFYSPFRWSNIADVRVYCRYVNEGKRPLASIETLLPAQLQGEAILLGLRRREGVDLLQWQKNFSVDFLDLAATTIDQLGGLETQGSPFSPSPKGALLILHQNRLALSQQGLLLYDYVCEELYTAVA